MTAPLSLSHLTVLALTPPEVVTVAAKAGYDCAGLRLLPAAPNTRAYPLMEDAAMLRETLARIADTGVGIFDLEIIRIDENFDVSDFQSFFDVGARLGAKSILVAGDDREVGRLTASYAALCNAALPFGLTADLEFMPWTAVPDLASATRIVAAVSRANAGILVDALHFARSSSSLSELGEVPRHWLHYAQICDAPAQKPAMIEGLIHAARYERQLPGEGGIDLVALWERLPADLPVSVEIPNEIRVRALGPERWARDALAATRSTLAKVRPEQDRIS
jgi:sugar phosphate isomerase/epimerase